MKLKLQQIDSKGYYGDFGGAYVPEVLKSKLEELDQRFEELKIDKKFLLELEYYQKNYIGRPSPLYFASNLSKKVGSKIYLKREDLNHTGSHKINNTIGQGLVAKYLNAKEIIAETGAGQHGVATATVAALLGIKCKVFMGSEDVKRQVINSKKIKSLGAELIEVDQGTKTLKDAVDGALEYYVGNPNSFYLLGSAVGPNPYPKMVAFFQSIIGKEAKKQILEVEKKIPDSIFACVGGGSNAIGLFQEFLDEETKIYGAEGGGIDLLPGKSAASLSIGKPIVFQGTYSYCIVNENGEQAPSYSISAGLDYPGMGPYHSYLKEVKRAEYYPIMDNEAIGAFEMLNLSEGISPAIESAHAVALCMKIMKGKNELSIVNLSGRGDKDIGRLDFN